MFWHIFWHSIWHSIWHIFRQSIWPLRSSGAHWAGQVPGWGPAVHTEVGRSQVEVQRCTPGWAGPRFRFSGAHWAGKLAKSLAKRLGKELGEELERRKCRWKLMQTWSRRNWRRRRRGGGRGGRGQLVEEEEEDEEEEDEAEEERSDKI